MDVERRSMTERKIEILKATEEKMLVTSLMKQTHMSYSVLKLIVDRFVETGLMTATPVTNYSRLVLLESTAKGIKIAKEYDRIVGALA